MSEKHIIQEWASVKIINRIVKLKSNWDSNYRYMVECKTPNGEIKRINLW